MTRHEVSGLAVTIPHCVCHMAVRGISERVIKAVIHTVMHPGDAPARRGGV